MKQGYIVVGLLVVLTECSIQVKTHANTEKSLQIGRKRITGGEVTGQRWKRSVLSLIAQRGLKAWKLLLKGTSQVPSGKHNVREFEKIGTLKTALRDFKDADPDYVQKLKFPSGITGRAGYIGDRTIILKARGSNGRPSIEIIKTQKTGHEIDLLIERITYTNKFTY